MRIKLRIALFAFAVLLAATVGTAFGANGLVQITDGVYGYVDDGPGTPGNLYAANVGVIIGDESVLVVDTLTSADEAKLLIADIRKITDKPIRYVFNTHYHLDHALGNSAFADIGAMIIAHSTCRETVITTGQQTLANPAAFSLPADFWKSTRVVPPSITFEREMKLNLGNLPVQFVYSGQPSHSKGSSIVILPTKQTVFTGDILFTDVHPYLGEADLPGWQRNLDIIAALGMKYIVPGHGPISNAQDIADLKEYLLFFDVTARNLSVTMDDPEAIIAEMLKRLPAKKWGDPLVGMNIHMKYMNKAQGYAD